MSSQPPPRDDTHSDQRIRTACLVILAIVAVGAA